MRPDIAGRARKLLLYPRVPAAQGVFLWMAATLISSTEIQLANSCPPISIDPRHNPWVCFPQEKAGRLFFIVVLRGVQRPMYQRKFRSLIGALVIALLSGGHAIAAEPTPAPVPPPAEMPPGLPTSPEVQTFAVCGVGTKCECDNVVSFAQAREGQSCTVTSSTGSCTYTSREDDVGVCCVCRP